MTDHRGTMSNDAPGVAGGGRPGHLQRSFSCSHSSVGSTLLRLVPPIRAPPIYGVARAEGCHGWRFAAIPTPSGYGVPLYCQLGGTHTPGN
jgi:hypothetical protein